MQSGFAEGNEVGFEDHFLFLALRPLDLPQADHLAQGLGVKADGFRLAIDFLDLFGDFLFLFFQPLDLGDGLAKFFPGGFVDLDDLGVVGHGGSFPGFSRRRGAS